MFALSSMIGKLKRCPTTIMKAPVGSLTLPVNSNAPLVMSDFANVSSFVPSKLAMNALPSGIPSIVPVTL